jgi:hypothetical protein
MAFEALPNHEVEMNQSCVRLLSVFALLLASCAEGAPTKANALVADANDDQQAALESDPVACNGCIADAKTDATAPLCTTADSSAAAAILLASGKQTLVDYVNQCRAKIKLPPGTVLLTGTTPYKAKWLECWRQFGSLVRVGALFGLSRSMCPLDNDTLQEFADQCKSVSLLLRAKCLGDLIAKELSQDEDWACRDYAGCLYFASRLAGMTPYYYSGKLPPGSGKLPPGSGDPTGHGWIQFFTATQVIMADPYNGNYYSFAR